MKIALLSRWLWEENHRSSGTVRQLAEAVQKQGHEVIALSQNPLAPSGITQSKIGNIETWLTPRYERRKRHYLTDKIGKLLTGHRKLRSDVHDFLQFLDRKGPFDLIWAQCEEPDGLVAALATKIKDLPPISTQVFALRYRFDAEGRPHFLQRRTLRFTMEAAQSVIANSPLTADALAKYYDISPTLLSILPHNLTHEFIASVEEGAPEKVNPQQVLFLGALNEKKGVLIFLEAAKQLHQLFPKMIFVMVGGYTESSFQSVWEAEVEKANLGKHLHVLGAISSAEVRKRILESAVIALPSLYDEFSRALVEVLAQGRPVISTETVGASYLLRRDDSGLVIPPFQAEALAEGIQKILADPSFQKNARANAKIICEEFAPDRIAAQLIEIWQTR